MAPLPQRFVGGRVLGIKIVCDAALALHTRLSLWKGAIFSVAQVLVKEGLFDDTTNRSPLRGNKSEH